jgi:hypothetical protein
MQLKLRASQTVARSRTLLLLMKNLRRQQKELRTELRELRSESLRLSKAQLKARGVSPKISA